MGEEIPIESLRAVRPTEHLILLNIHDVEERNGKQILLQQAGFQTQVCLSVEEVVAIAKTRLPSLLIVEAKYQSADAADFVSQVYAHLNGQEIPVVLLFFSFSPEIVWIGRAQGWYVYIWHKPDATSQFLTVISHFIVTTSTAEKWRKEALDLLAQNSRNARAYLLLSQAYNTKFFNTAKALEAIQKALEIEPDNPEIHYTMAKIVAPSNAAEAIDHLKQAIRLRPNYAEAYYDLGTVYLYAGHKEIACSAFRDAVKYGTGGVKDRANSIMKYYCQAS